MKTDRSSRGPEDGRGSFALRLYFRFDLEFTYHGHAFATWLKRERSLDDASFRAMVAGRVYHHFLTSVQHDISYPHLVTFQDLMWRARTEPPDLEFLGWMERELDIDTLWRLFGADRTIQGWSYQQALSAMTIFLRYFWEEFTENRPDAVISFTTANLAGLACYYVAKRLGIPYLEFTTTRLYQRALVTVEPLHEFPQVAARYRQLLDAPENRPSLLAAEEYIRSFREAPRPPDGVNRARQILHKSTSIHPRRLVGWLRVNYWWYFGHYRKDTATDPPMKQAVDVLRMKLRQRRMGSAGFFDAPPGSGERFAFFALHHQPEMTTMILAPFWQDQVALIENIGRSLPVGMRLYVKEHVPMLGMRPIAYYERLRRIPNVVLVDPYASSLDLARRAAVVLTITGTIGIESLMLGTPLITFGRIFYNAVEGVRKVRAIEDLPRAIRDAMVDGPASDRHVRAYVAALIEESFPFDAEQLWDPTRSYESVRDTPATRAIYEAYLRVLDRVRPAATA